ncbi:MAG: PEGA domain-containing protein [Spirochaetia bacterium]
MPRGYTHTVMNASRASLVVFRLSAPAAGLLAALAVGMLTSCSTTGSGSAPVTVTQGSAPQQEKPPTQVPTTKQGLEIVSDPDRAEIWVDGDFKGLTPFIVTDVTQGWHQLLLRKAGYREVSTWLQFTSDYMLYQTSLTRITGFLQIDVSPPNAVVTVANSVVSPGLQELPVGSYTVSVRAFGYADFTGHVTITEKTVTPLSVNLLPAPFAVADFSLLRGRVNPDNPGVLGVVEGRFAVTGPGTGKIEVYDPEETVVFTRALPDFETWSQSFAWDVRDNAGRPLADGDYRVVLSGQGKGGESSRQEAELRVDRTLKIAPRSLWSGSAGLLFAPVAEVLPPEEFQASVLGAAYAQGAAYQAPLSLGIRLGIGSRLEIDATGAIIPASTAIPFAVGAAVRWNFLSPAGEYGMGAAVEAKASFQYDSSPTGGNVLLTDVFTDSTGLHIALPAQLVLGPVSILGTIGLTTSLWAPYGSTTPGALAWLYLRGGVLADIGSVTTGVSVALRTQPFSAGFLSAWSDFPFQLGAEAHWLVPGTRVIVSAMAAGVFNGAASYAFEGGGGLGFLY